MSNASHCRVLADRYKEMAELAVDPREYRAYAKLERLWREMSAEAERFDRLADDLAKERIYTMIDAVGAAWREEQSAVPPAMG